MTARAEPSAGPLDLQDSTATFGTWLFKHIGPHPCDLPVSLVEVFFYPL
jgi:hypothetical protein